MCGITGIITTSSQNNLQIKIEAMKEALYHRGPDDEGTFINVENTVALGHRRLAIIDPKAGAQPLTTLDNRYTIVFNGAIYNYVELRHELLQAGHPIKTHCDTEILLYAYVAWGRDCLKRLRGMFAFAIWDDFEKTLFCSRDRLGIKPFYFLHHEGYFVFASEIKAILAAKCIKPQMNKQALQDYLTFQFCLGDTTLFKDITKLEPGHYLFLRWRTDKIELSVRQYWDIDFETSDETLSEKLYAEKLTVLLEESCRLHLRADVPVGAHLSGGLDSSTVVCLASRILNNNQLKTFTGAFAEGNQYDETAYAKIVAEMARTAYYDIYIQGNELSEILPQLMYFMDEPLAGPGLIPQYYVSRLASEHVKVVLGGQGGDELYMGYARYFIAYLEKALKQAIWPEQANERLSLNDIIPHLPLLQDYKPMIQGFFKEGLFESDDQRYFNLVNRSSGYRHLYEENVFAGDESFARFQRYFNKSDSLINNMSYFDLKASLPALLHVEDRTSMAVSLESRVPLLDHHLVEFITRVPAHIKFANGKTKHLFREAVRNIVPKKIIERKDKMGFPVPLNDWFQGPAKTFVEDILFSKKTAERGIFDMAALRSIYQEKHAFSRVLWGAICLELWHRTFIDIS